MKHIKHLFIASLFPMVAQAGNIMECESFSGNWSRASVERVEGNSYTIEIKLWGKEPKVFVGEMKHLGYRDRDEDDDSPYEEVNYSFFSEDLEGLEVNYTLTSDGADYLHLKSSTIKSSLSCR